MVVILRSLVILFSSILRPFRKGRSAGEIECLLVGYCGTNNTGAEARTAEAIDQLLSLDNRIRCTLTTLDVRQTERYVKKSSRVWLAKINPIFLFGILKLVWRSDVVILIEGCCFNDKFSSVLLWLFLYAADLAQRMGLPTIAYGVDVGTLSKKNRGWARSVASKLDLVMLRTSLSRGNMMRLAPSVSPEVTADTVFTLQPKGSGWAKTVLSGQGLDLDKRVVGIAFEEFYWWPITPSLLRALLRRSEGHFKSIYYHTWDAERAASSDSMKRSIAAYADYLSKEYDAQVVFFAMDRAFIDSCRDVMNLMNGSSVLIDSNHADAGQMLALVGECDWLVSCDYHAILFSIMQGIPFIGIGDDERISGIMDELGLLHNQFISHKEVDMLEELVQKTTSMQLESVETRSRIKSLLPSYLFRMSENGRLFGEFINQKFNN
jgi:polysaccharide pyruvyl transferase WcaK-like protein